MEELFEILDGGGRVVGIEKRSIVHEKGLLHRAADVFVLDKEGRIFIQQRSFNKLIDPGLWDMSAAEHLKPGETYEQAAARGVKEELGAEPVNIEKIGKAEFHFRQGEIRDNEKKEVFKCRFEGEMKLNPEEVEQGKWVSKEAFLKEMEENPKKFTPWLLQDKKFVELV